MKNYSTSIEINAPVEKVFKAITQELDAWWGKQSCLIDKKGIEFKVDWGEPWYQLKVIEYIPNKKLVWKCTDANQLIKGLDDVDKEWVGTQIHWNLENTVQNKTILIFEHQGLSPKFICFDVCSKSWDRFLKSSLKEYCER